MSVRVEDGRAGVTSLHPRCLICNIFERYADDFVILCRTNEDADAALAEVKQWRVLGKHKSIMKPMTESPMREIRQSGLAGGEVESIGLPYPDKMGNRRFNLMDQLFFPGSQELQTNVDSPDWEPVVIAQCGDFYPVLFGGDECLSPRLASLLLKFLKVGGTVFMVSLNQR